jgi:hypothetical protein
MANTRRSLGNIISIVFIWLVAIVLLILWLAEFNIFGNTSQLKLSRLFGTSTVLTTSTNFQDCVSNKGNIDFRAIPRTCSTGDKILTEKTTLSGAEYLKLVEKDAYNDHKEILFKPKIFSSVDGYRDDQHSYFFLKTNGKDDKIMEVTRDDISGSTANLFNNGNNTLSKTGLITLDKIDQSNFKGYNSASTQIVNVGNRLAGDIRVNVYAKIRDNYVILSAPINSNVIEQASATCLEKSDNKKSTFEADTLACFRDILQKDSTLIGIANNIAKELLSDFSAE